MRRINLTADVAIAGGGMAGMTLAVALAKAGLRVVLVDRLQPQELASDAFDGRVSALAFSSVRMLRALDLWDGLAADAQPINEILVNEGRLSGRPLPFSLHFDHREIGEPLGHIVENRHIRRALMAAIAAQPNLHFISGASVTALVVDEGEAALEVSGGRQISAKAGRRRGRPRLRVARRARNRRDCLGLRSTRHRHHGGT